MLRRFAFELRGQGADFQVRRQRQAPIARQQGHERRGPLLGLHGALPLGLAAAPPTRGTGAALEVQQTPALRFELFAGLEHLAALAGHGTFIFLQLGGNAHRHQCLLVAGQIPVQPAADGPGIPPVSGDLFAPLIQPLRTDHQRLDPETLHLAGEAEARKTGFIAEDHALGGGQLFEGPLHGRGRFKDLGGLEILIADLATNLEVLAVDVRGQLNEFYFGGWA